MARPADMATEIAALEARRRARGMSHEALVVAAGIGVMTWRRAVWSGRARPATVLAVRAALRRRRRRGEDAPVELVQLRRVIAGAVADSAAAAIGGAGKLATYLLVTGVGVPGARAAAAIGVSKQYVSRVLAQMENLREDPAFEAAVVELEERLFGDEG